MRIQLVEILDVVLVAGWVKRKKSRADTGLLSFDGVGTPDRN